MSATERELQHAIRLALGRHPHVRLFRNQVGECDYIDRQGKPRHVTYGLAKGSPDLVGWRTIDVPGLGPIAQFVGIELKAPGSRTDRSRLQMQRMFIENLRARGGLAAMVDTLEEAVQLFDAPLFPNQ